VKNCQIEKVIPIPEPTTYEFLVGGFAASLLSVSYLIVPIYMIISFVCLILYFNSIVTWVMIGPIILSAILPPFSSKYFLQVLSHI
jgi:hypothetical protein